jgi:hypothetical protein
VVRSPRDQSRRCQHTRVNPVARDFFKRPPIARPAADMCRREVVAVGGVAVHLLLATVAAVVAIATVVAAAAERAGPSAATTAAVE